jgi:hypothetical protein
VSETLHHSTETDHVNRLALAFRAFFKVLFDEALAQGVAEALNPPPAPPLPTPEAPKFDLRVLALLQRDGRLIDFLMETIDDYDDAQVGAAVRKVHADCRKSLTDHFTIEPIGAGDGSAMKVPVGYDAAAIRLTGAVSGEGPWSGTIAHHGWHATEVRVPDVPGAFAEVPVLQPLEVEV